MAWAHLQALWPYLLPATEARPPEELAVIQVAILARKPLVSVGTALLASAGVTKLHANESSAACSPQHRGYCL